MSRNIALIAVILFSLSIIPTSGAVAMPTHAVNILPEDCTLLAGEELSLTLDGFIPPNAVVRWDVNEGGITSVLPGWNALFIAPSQPSEVTISVSISAGVSGAETVITRQCNVTSLNNAPNGFAQIPDAGFLQ
jgi:hypothetical protein